MKSYLVDFENVKSKGLAGIDKLTENDHVVIFYSENSDTISFDMHCSVMRSKASVEYIKVRVGGKNALDFQLSTLLGYMVAQETNTHIFIISNDKGFDKLHDFWENTFEDSPKCVVFRTQNINSAINFAKHSRYTPSDEPSEDTESEQTSASCESETDIAETEENTEQRSKSAEIIVTATDEADGAQDAPESSDETKFIVPEPLIDKFKQDPSGDNARKEAARRRSEKNDRLQKTRPKNPPAEYFSEATVKVSDPNAVDPAIYITQPKYLAPGEKNVGLEYFKNLAEESIQPVLKTLLEDPENHNKAHIVRNYVPDVDENTLNDITEAIIASSCKLDFHNRLAKLFTAEVSTAYYNKVKPHYDFAKRMFKEIDTVDGNVEQTELEKQKNREKEAEIAAEKEKNAFWQKKIDELKPIELEISEKPADEVKEVKKKPRRRKNQPIPKKVDATLKKRLHQILDDSVTADEFSATVDIVSRAKGTHDIYIGMIKRFGKKRGTAIYNEIKTEVAETAPAKEES